MFLQNHNGAFGFSGADLDRGGESSASSPVRPRSGVRGVFRDGREGTLESDMGMEREIAAGGVGGVHETGGSPERAKPRAVDVRKGTFPSISTRGASFHTAVEHGVGGGHGWNDTYYAKQGGQRKAGCAPSAQSNVTRMDRRQAWIRFLALDTCKDVCIESIVSDGASATDVEFARVLVKDGCKMMKDGLGLGGLLLGGGHGSAGRDGCGAGGVNIHWDDVESGGERIVMLDDGRREDVLGTMAARETPIKAQRGLDGPTKDKYPSGNDELHVWVPAVEVKVSRVVGAPFLDTVSHDASVDEGPGDYSIRAFVKGGVPCDSAIGSTGGVVSGRTLCIGSDQVTSVKDALYLEVYRKGNMLEACGTVMISELQRLAVRSDALGQEPAPSFFKQLMHPSGFGFKKRKESGGSMIWAKLVATDGAPAGHVLLAAKARPGRMGGQVVVGPTNIYTSGMDVVNLDETHSVSGSGSGNAPVIPSRVNDGAMKADVQTNLQKTPLQIRAHHGAHGHHGVRNRVSPHHKGQVMDLNYLGCVDDVDDMGGEDGVVLKANSPAPLPMIRRAKHYGNISGGYLQVNSRHVYDVLLDCALRGSGCDLAGSSLELQPQWLWLTRQFAKKHGIREEYATLAYLQWILENHRVQPNSMCFEVIAAKHIAMKTASSSSSLESHEIAMNSKVRQDIKSLLNKTFENYFALKQNYDDDVEFVPTRGPQAATVLRSAIKLLFLVLDGDTTGAGQWMSVRFKRAASKRFYAILAGIEAQIIEEVGRGRSRADVADRVDLKLDGGRRKPGTQVKGNHAGQDVIAYKKVGDLCRSIIEEIREDEGIQSSLSQSITSQEGSMIPLISENTSMEYIKGVSAHLKAVLTRYPPRMPIPAAIALVQAVGNLQHFLERHEYMDAAVRLNAFEAFSEIIQRWISSSSASLQRGVQIIDETPGSGPGRLNWKDLHENKGNMVVPFAEVLLQELQKEMEIYHPILGIWASYAVDVERACVDVLRQAISVASRQCGLVQYSSSSMKDASSSKRRTAWKWMSTGAAMAPDGAHDGVTDAIRQGTNVLQALLMNTLRRLLAVMPQIELTIQAWCEDRPETSVAHGENNDNHTTLPAVRPADRQPYSASPELGALWAQLVKEVRTEYYATITLTAEALSRQLSACHATSVQYALRKSGLESSESSMVRKSERALDQTSPTLRILSSVLDSRVFVALSRGLWDLTARQILQYAEDLTEGKGGTKGAWRGRQNAAVVLSCVENFFRHEISTCMGNDLQPKDLDPPQHFQRAKALVSKGSNRVDQSFDVY